MVFYYFYFFFIFLLSVFMFSMFLWFKLSDLIYLIDWEIISYQSSSILMVFLIDWMSLLFMSFVLLISSLVILYSKEYMVEDSNVTRFIILIVMFVFSMMMLIISPNIMSILLGWDGLGLVSYCLVIYFQNVKSFNAGMLTALVNRVGDVFLLLAISWMFSVGSWNFYYYLSFIFNSWEMLVVSSLVLLATMTKSAQIPFSSWLPAAMAAPTPVSALVHSSTLVTAGVYLLIRFSSGLSECHLFILLLLGSLTMFMSGLGASYEMDLKKIIALSTLSQLGLMMGILALGYFKLTFYHLLTHALFKALLFLCAGAFIHSMLNFQDVRMAGGFMGQMPLSLMTFNISNLALCGFPFMAGFYSKDIMLEMMMMSQINFTIFFSTGLTVIYTFRLIFFSGVMNFNSISLLCINDESWGLLKSLIILAFFSICGGSILSWLIFPFPLLVVLPYYLKYLILLICVLGGLLGYFLFSSFKLFFYKFLNFKLFINLFFSLMWFMPSLSTIGVSKLILIQGNFYSKGVDFGWNELLGGGILLIILNKVLNQVQLFHINYFKMSFIFLLCLLILLLF